MLFFRHRADSPCRGSLTLRVATVFGGETVLVAIMSLGGSLDMDLELKMLRFDSGF